MKAGAIGNVGKAKSGAVVSVPSPPGFGSLSPVAEATPCDRDFVSSGAESTPGAESTEAAINLKRARVVREDPTPHR